MQPPLPTKDEALEIIKQSLATFQNTAKLHLTIQEATVSAMRIQQAIQVVEKELQTKPDKPVV